MSKDLQKLNKISKQNNVKSLSNINIGALNNSLGELVLPRLFYQLVIFILDGSGSMTFEGISGKSKGEEINENIKTIIKRLQQSKNSNGFDIAIWGYSQECVKILEETPVKKINVNSDFNPCNYLENGITNINKALIEAEKKVNDYLTIHKNRHSQALIILLSDGAIHDQSKAEVIVKRLKLRRDITITSYLLEDKRWKDNMSKDELNKLRENLKNLSSSSGSISNQFFKSTVDPEEVRKHMIQSISAVSNQK